MSTRSLGQDIAKRWSKGGVKNILVLCKGEPKKKSCSLSLLQETNTGRNILWYLMTRAKQIIYKIDLQAVFTVELDRKLPEFVISKR